MTDDVFKDLEAKRTGCRRGGSRTYDKEGNLIEENGEPVVGNRKKSESKTRGGK